MIRDQSHSNFCTFILHVSNNTTWIVKREKMYIEYLEIYAIRPDYFATLGLENPPKKLQYSTNFLNLRLYCRVHS